MSVLNDILSWAEKVLKPWHLDALRRLCEKQDLEPQDFDDLYAMLKSTHGLPDPHDRKPVPLAESQLPVQAASTSPVIIKSLGNLKDVNRIAPGQILEFAPKGLTVVYGPNASGKSGYSRVLKRACRARGLSETIHPNAFDPAAATNIPEATFIIEVGGKDKTLVWKRDDDPYNELSTISVFDGRSARAYLDEEQDVAFRPYGLDILQNFGQCVLPELDTRLDAESTANNTDVSAFNDLLNDTEVGKLIASLCATTDCDKIAQLATLNDAERNRLSELEKALSEKDPAAKAKDLRLRAQRLDGLISRIGTAIALVDSTLLNKFEKCDNEAVAASKAAAIAAAEFRGGESLLPGTGDDAWKYLFLAARRFSTESAYQGKAFPYVGTGAQCPLCQQELDEEASKRMLRFEEFIKNDTAKTADEKRHFCEREVETIRTANLGFALDSASKEELMHLDTTLLKATQDLEDSIEARRKWLLDAFVKHNWVAPPALADDPRSVLETLSKESATQAADLEKTTDDEQKKLLEHERAELSSRANLAQRKSAILDLVKRLQIEQRLMDCKNDLKTKAISDKAKELGSKAVTVALKDALNSEFALLGVGYVKVTFKHSAKQVRIRQKLVLDIPKASMKPGELLSEGEQRAIAISSFLAELHLAGHKGAIVFDDPVSSLDHHWRQNVAARLVSEAKVRQVIILTHDTTFLGDLRDALEQEELKHEGVSHLIQHLECRNDQPGHVSKGLPWEQQSYGARLDRLEKEQRSLIGVWPEYPNESERRRMRGLYSDLRATIERVVQEVVFNGVVDRYRDWIKVGKLGAVAGLTTSDCDAIVGLFRRCSGIIDAHDTPSVKMASVPSAAELGKDIESLQKVISSIKTRRKGAGSKPRSQ
jgi:hypothetical protein